MKNIILAACVAAFSAVSGAYAQTAQQPCDCVILTEEQPTTYRLLTSNNCYLLEECYIVQSGQTLEIEPGTVIFGDVNTKGSLIIERGGTLIADGQPNPMVSPDPIIFTSSAPVNARAPGDWGGITILGYAENNIPSTGEIDIDRSCGTFTGGGNDDDDNSGILRYVQIHYAGGEVSGDEEVSALTMISAGSETVIDHIQITYSARDAFSFLGGTVNAAHLVSYNTYKSDFRTIFGYRGNVQFGVSVRLDEDAHHADGSYGIESANNYDSTNNYAGSPLTQSVFSNMTFFGPEFCDATGLSGDFQHGVYLSKGTAQSVYNSVIARWPEYGLFIEDGATVANTDDILNFSYNSFYNNTAGAYNTPVWTSGCGADMTEWIEGGFGAPLCAESENQVSGISILGYNKNSICGNYCSMSYNPDFSLSNTTDLEPIDELIFSDIEDLDKPFFTPVEYRGAFSNTDWTDDWTNWCPVATNYCPEQPRRGHKTGNPGNLNIVPNPASDVAYVLFDAIHAGNVQVSVLDKVSGQTLRTVKNNVHNTGSQRIAIPVSGLQAGVYLVKIVLPDGKVLTGQLFVL